ncbi:hypothetical protein [Quatrionicoccus australiensis]|uniref:hypothetical protein n=1 Tax=Quatrionicoccus australiensis TaxID=138118 RepID=UPI001CF919B2|nr:hypothetical protein [Quatrionicoccus australiensis]UCV16399.1 hypothetical protein KI612_06800 [Quatrionicoccus australiensis]
MTHPVSDQTDVPHVGHDLGHVVVKYILPYNTLLAFSAGVAALTGYISTNLLVGLAALLLALGVTALVLDLTIRKRLVDYGRSEKAGISRRLVHFLWPSYLTRIYRTGPFIALLLITTGMSIYAAHHVQQDAEAKAERERVVAQDNEGITVGNPALNIKGMSAYIKAGSIKRIGEYGVLRFTLIDPQLKQFIIGDGFSQNPSKVKSAEILAEFNCDTGSQVRELSVTTYPESNLVGQATTILARELYWRDTSKKQKEIKKLSSRIEMVVCAYHRPGEAMDDD